MGYYTDFNLNLTKVDGSEVEPELKKAIKLDLSDISEYYWYDDLLLSSIKWYSYHENMLELSKIYPDIIFRLIGEREVRSDTWCIYYNNGLFQKTIVPEIVYEEFDPEKLVSG